MAQLGIEPRSLALCLLPAGTYTASVIPLDHCALLYYSVALHSLVMSLVTYLPREGVF